MLVYQRIISTTKNHGILSLLGLSDEIPFHERYDGFFSLKKMANLANFGNFHMYEPFKP